jgi:hypothetical protein
MDRLPPGPDSYHNPKNDQNTNNVGNNIQEGVLTRLTLSQFPFHDCIPSEQVPPGTNPVKGVIPSNRRYPRQLADKARKNILGSKMPFPA